MAPHRFRWLMWGFVALNLAGLLLFLACWFIAAPLDSMASTAAVTELDRADVFNRAKLKAHKPALAENLRYNVADRIAGPALQQSIWNARFGVVLAAINIALALLAVICVERSTAPAEPTAAEPQESAAGNP
jgi:hypothetical protein